jgi:hypothetical protein
MGKKYIFKLALKGFGKALGKDKSTPTSLQ